MGRFLFELSKCQETQEAAAVAVVESQVVVEVATAAPAEEDVAEIEVAAEEPQGVHQASSQSRWPCAEVHLAVVEIVEEIVVVGLDRLVDHMEEAAEEAAEEAGSTSKRP